jgi:hypothetical protein
VRDHPRGLRVGEILFPDGSPNLVLLREKGE